MRRRLFWAALVVALLVLAAVGLFIPKDKRHSESRAARRAGGLQPSRS